MFSNEENVKKITIDLIDGKIVFKRYNEDVYDLKIEDAPADIKKIIERLSEINSIF